MKEDYSLVRYEFFETIEDKYPLAELFNILFRNLHTAKIISAPTTFEDMSSEKRGDVAFIESALLFKRLCLFEMYLHSIVKRLEDWKACINEYNNEFNSSWKYYAISKRIDGINEYGGDDSDYDKDGNVRSVWTNEELRSDTIISRLLNKDWRDIFIQTTLEDIDSMLIYISVDASLSIKDIFKKAINFDLKTYREENGEMIENSWEDEALYKASNMNRADNLIDTSRKVFKDIRKLIDDVDSLNEFDDNKSFFECMPDRINEILNLNIINK